MRAAARGSLAVVSTLAAALTLAPAAAAAPAATGHVTAPPVRAQGPAGGSPQLPPPTSTSADPSAQSGSGDGPGPLVANGLGSPVCADRTLRAALTPNTLQNCAASGAVEAPAPLEHYEFDVHINTGIGDLGNDLIAAFQDLIVTPAWIALLWFVHVALVALEWCYSLDLLGSGTLAPIAAGLDSMRDALTEPWLATVLAIAAATFVYHGVIRRRVVETLGQFGLMLAMMAGGLWVIADPAGTVGRASQLVNEASLGTLAAASSSDPNQPVRSFDGSLQLLFDTAIGGPWCYLEFGSVDWCREPGTLDPRLVAAGRHIAVLERSAAQWLAADCAGSAPPFAPHCTAHDTPAQHELLTDADLLDRAHTNGGLFLALPANGAARNSINAAPPDASLLRVLCGSADATACTASTGPQAQFRTEQGTWPRTGGLLLIALGVFGLLAVLAFIGLRLLAAALMAVFMLLLAPVAVLAPALGDGGRAAFRVWTMRLLGAVLAKLVYSVFLGVSLLMVRVLSDLDTLGWWTQWLLIAAFWWILFRNRHRLLEYAIHERQMHRSASLGSRLFAARQSIRLGAPAVRGARGLVRRRWEDLRRLDPPARRRAPGRSDEFQVERAAQVARTLEHDYAAAVATMARSPALEAQLAEQRARRERLRGEQRAAARAGERRRAISLALRAERLEAAVASRQLELDRARATTAHGEQRLRRTGVVYDGAQLAGRAELLDREAGLRPLAAASSDRRLGRRDYPALAGLAGLARGEYELLGAAEQRHARLRIDRALERRIRTRTSGGGPDPPRQRERWTLPRPLPVSRRGRQFGGRTAPPLR